MSGLGVTLSTQQPIPRRVYGFFRCTKCNRSWESSQVYKKPHAPLFYKQGCARCKIQYTPYRWERLICSACGQQNCACARRHTNPGKSHRSDLCEKCRAGDYCTAARTASSHELRGYHDQYESASNDEDDQYDDDDDEEDYYNNSGDDDDAEEEAYGGAVDDYFAGPEYGAYFPDDEYNNYHDDDDEYNNYHDDDDADYQNSLFYDDEYYSDDDDYYQ